MRRRSNLLAGLEMASPPSVARNDAGEQIVYLARPVKMALWWDKRANSGVSMPANVGEGCKQYQILNCHNADSDKAPANVRPG